jgi:lysozyme family protein
VRGTADFNRAILKISRYEGVEFDPDGRPVPGRTGHVNHPDDPGGETNYGVTRRVALENGWTGPMRDIPYPKVLDIYRRRYWDDDIPDQEIAEELFGTGVNCGMPVVKKFLQRTLNVLNAKRMKYPDLVVDGVVGPRTIDALRRALTVAP